MKRLLYVAILLFVTSNADAQYKWEYGLAIGGANYLGDIGGQADIGRDFVPWDMHLGQTNIAIGAYGRYKASKRFSLAANFTYLQVNDADNISTNPARVARNLNFRNRMFELGLRGEFTVFYDNDVGGKGYYNPDFRLYVFGGLSAFRHNPQGQILSDPTGEFDAAVWHDLRGWRTEGQDEEYETIGLAIPAGIGLYFTFNKEWRIGWEISYRTTFTDYIDDLSTTYADPELIRERLGGNTSEAAAAVTFSSQTNQTIIDFIADPINSGTVYDHSYQEGFATKRGDSSQNDGFLTSQFTIGKVIRGSSNFYRKKYSWLRNRTGSRKSRAKF